MCMSELIHTDSFHTCILFSVSQLKGIGFGTGPVLSVPLVTVCSIQFKPEEVVHVIFIPMPIHTTEVPISISSAKPVGMYI